MIYYAAQAVGFLGMAVVIYTFQQNRQKRISAFQGLTCLIFAIHFTMLGAVSGMAMNAVGVFRRGGLKVAVFEAKAPYLTYLGDLDKNGLQRVNNLRAEQEDLGKYAGLKVGSMDEPSINGNWE